MFFAWMRRISRRPVGPEIPMSTSQSKLPNRLSEGLMELGRLVAAMTTTLERAFMPPMSVSNCDITQRSTSPLVCHANFSVQSLQNVYSHTHFHVWERSNLSHR